MRQQSLIAPIIITAFLVIILIFYFSNFLSISRDIIIFGLTILQIVSLFFLYLSPQTESFYFEVSPQRKKCLEEQVSLHHHSRSCDCCPKGTVGGYPPMYKDWLTADGKNGLWKRTDNYTTNPESHNLDLQIPPVEYVPEENNKILSNNSKTFPDGI